MSSPGRLSSPTSSLVRGALALLSTQPLTWGASLLVAILVPRFLGDEALGQYAVAMTAANLVGLAASLGVPQYLRREVATNPQRVHLDGSVAMVLVVGTALAMALAIGGALALLGYTARFEILLVALIGMVVASPQTVLFALLIGQERHKLFAWFNAVSVALSTAAGIVILIMGGDVVAYMLAGIAGYGLVTIVGWRFAGIHFQTASLNSRLLRQLARCGLPFLGWGIALQVYGEVDKLLLAAFSPAAVVGWYAAAYRIVNIPAFIPTLLVTPLLPVLSRCADSPGLVRQTLGRSAGAALILTAPLCGLLVGLAPRVPELLHWPEPFHNSVPLLMILALHVPAVAVDMVLGTALIALGREHKWLVVGIVAAVFNPALNLVLIPFFEQQVGNGAIGAAIVTVLTELLMFTGAIVLLPRTLLSRSFVTVGARISVAAVSLAAVVALVQQQSILLAVVLGCLTYVLALVASGVLRAETLQTAPALVLRLSAWSRASTTGAVDEPRTAA